VPSDGPEKPAPDKASSKPNDNSKAKSARKVEQRPAGRKAPTRPPNGRAAAGTATLTAAPPQQDAPVTPKPSTRLRTARKWVIRGGLAVAAIAVLWQLFLVFVGIATSYMWFDSVHHGAVYTTIVKAQVLLFLVFAVIGGLVGGLTMLGLLRMHKRLHFGQKEDPFRWTFRRLEPRVRWLIVLLAVAVPAILTGKAAAARWQTYLLWAHATPWHVSDPQFHKDVSFFVEIYPFHVVVVSLLSQAVKYGLWIAVIGGYWYGGWRPRKAPQKVTRNFTALMCVLLAAYLLLKGASYWLSRYSLTTSSRGPVTGVGYTDAHAALPGAYVLVALAVLAALALIANVLRRARVRVVIATLAVFGLIWAMVGTAWPALVYHFQEAPSAASLDLAEIAHNQKATLDAFGLASNVSTVTPKPSPAVQGKSLVQLAGKTSQMSLIDPNQLSPTFNVEQQLQAYYGFKGTLDLGHYDINGRSQDVALAARELQSSGIPKPSWVNSHLVYTHGYGVVAAPVDTVDPKTQSPVFLNGGMPPGQQIPIKRPQIYFGQAFSSGYVIVGQPPGSTHKPEFDHPGSNGSGSAYTRYKAHGGIPIGSTLRRFLWAVQLHDPNIFFSSEINKASQLLENRNPRARVAKVAPWLTLDGDVYPAIVDGQIKWIVDGYTTTSNYPDSQSVNLNGATSTTLTSHGASVAQPNTSVNYMQNSVKAVVDAYTGKVTLYEWNQQQRPDPLLKTWESVFPHLVQPQSSIPSALMSQLRYPTDLFNMQRYLLARYHVGQPANFYSGDDFWAVPSDPTVAAAKTINSKGVAHTGSTPTLPSRYASMALDNTGNQHYSLSSPMVTLNGRQLSAFVYVNSEPGPDYGKFTVLEFPPGTGGESPLQVQNDIESNTKITEALTLQRGGNSRVVLGGLEAVPVNGQLLYVEPIYTQSNGGASFPILRHVIALYGTGDPSFATSLSPALRDAISPAP
jgi:hypothetical protein